MNENDLHSYQRYAVDFIEQHPAAGLFLDMGLGKTVSTLTAVIRLIENLEISKVLVIAPKRVAADTWPAEVQTWEHLQGVRVSVVRGTQKQRIAALRAEADIYTIGRDNVVWLVSYYEGRLPFDMLVVDELSSFKSSKAQRFKALKVARSSVSRVVGLTGTPAPNGLMDLWSQIFLLDGGERLGKHITGFRNQFFKPGRSNGHVVYNYLPLPGSEESIYSRISDICVSMRAEDYIQLPERIDITHQIDLPAGVKEQYVEFEKTEVLKLADAAEKGEITAANAAALSNKLLQFSNGAIYDADRLVHQVHDEKLEALEEIIEAANGEPVLVFYSFRHDIVRIKNRLKSYRPRELQTSKDISDWNAGKIPVLLAHPAGAGHGLNLQRGGSVIVWFGLNWSLELYQQANARLHRQGQTKPVRVYHLICKDTLDGDVLKALTGKADQQNALMSAVQARIKKYAK